MAVILGDRLVTADEMEHRVAQAAGLLAACGIGQGDVVALLLRNDLPFIEASLACARLGAVPLPLNWHLTEPELAYILTDSEAKLILAHADLLPRAGAAAAALPRLIARTTQAIAAAYGIAEHVADPALDWDTRRDAAAPWTAPPVPVPHPMLYTSGTTGLPKGVRRVPPTPDQAEAMRRMQAKVFGLKPGIRTVTAAPLYHAAPNAMALAAIRGGGTLVIAPRFDAAELLALIERHRITTLFLVPIMFVRLLRLPEAVRRRHDLSLLEHVTHGAAPCPPEVKRAMIAWWGPVLHDFYGATELGAVTSVDSAEWLAHPGTLGRALPGVDLRILDEAGRDCPQGTPGEIFVRQGNYPPFTYHHLPERRAEIEREGFVTCGDVGHLDDEGRLFLHDRKRDMAISGGVNIYPAEIEAALALMPGVADSAVFGIPDAEFGESLAALIQPLPGATVTPEAVRAFLATRLTGFKIPRLIETRATLPRDDNGKILKRRLREPYWRDAGRSI
jgi:long-chain acyl-CoA synthetase